MIGMRKAIPRVAPRAYEYVKQILDFGFHNAHSVGITARLEREFAARFGQTCGIAHCNGTATMQSALMAAGVGVEDNAQCILGRYKGRVAGSIGHFASFSFQASKTITCGDGGILICSDESLALAARKAATVGYKDLTLKPGDNVVSEQLRCRPDYQRHDTIGWNQRLPEIAAAVALAELERVEELAEMRAYAAAAFDAVVQQFKWLVPQKTPEGYANAYWTYAVRIARESIGWSDVRAAFVEMGGDGFYGCYQPAHLEPVFARLNRAVDDNPARYPHFAGRLPRYERGTCPVWETIQPRILMLKTNYFDTVDADRQADVLARAVKRFD